MALTHAAKNVVKVSSQETYINYFLLYAYWCFTHDVSIWHFPVDHGLIASFIYDEICRGLKYTSIRGEKSAIAWWYNTWHQKNNKNFKREGMFDSDHPLLVNIMRYGSKINPSSPFGSGIPLTRKQLIYLYNYYFDKYISKNIFNNEVIHFCIFLFCCLTSGRVHMAIPYRYWSKKVSEGLRYHQLKVEFKQKQYNYLYDTYGIFIPNEHIYKILALSFQYTHSKTTFDGYEFIRYIGITNKTICPCLLLIKLFNFYNKQFNLSNGDYVFKLVNGRPCDYKSFSNWIAEMRILFYDQLGTNLASRIRSQSGRKTFANILDSIGYSQSRIGNLGMWKTGKAISKYICPPRTSFINVAKDMFYAKQIHEERDYSVHYNC